MTTILACRNITKRYGDVCAIDQVSLAIGVGEIVVIIGRSGSGKSTLLRCLALLEEPDEGELDFRGARVFPAGQMSKQESSRQHRVLRSSFGFVFQNVSLWPHMSVLENVSTGLRVVKGLSRNFAKSQAELMLKLVGVDHLWNCMPETLSGGESQRVAIARAMAMQPEVLCLDEITSSLDPERVSELLRIIRNLKSQFKTMIIVTHHIQFAKEIADRIVFVDEGKVVEIGAPGEVLTNPQSKALRSLLNLILASH